MLHRRRRFQREIPSRRILPRFQLNPHAANSWSRIAAAMTPSFIGFPTSSMEGAIVRWLSSVGYRSSAIVRWPSVTTGDSTSANPPSLPDSAINGLLPTAPYVPSLIQFQSWLPSWKGETPCIFFIHIWHRSNNVPSSDSFEEESTIGPSTNADAIIIYIIYSCVIMRDVWPSSACLMSWLF